MAAGLGPGAGSGDQAEVVLHGGNTNTVVRVGDTVRRTAGAWTPTVHALLRHLEATGFDAAPRALGLDAQRREMLTFIEGTTRAGFVEFLTLLADVSQPITIEYFDERGPQPQQTCTLPARTRVTIRVNADPGPSPDGVCRDGFYGDGAGHDVSVRLMGTDEFRAERVVYHQPGVVSGSSASSASTGDHD